jgi:6-pyruvoyltetrahydropterin/6-carboxytetrahydropterin synthase
MTSVVVRHNFEAAHRLPHLGGKCRNLHGHSWWVEVTVEGAVDTDGIVVDFGTLKKGIRAWIDTELDHGSMLGAADPLVRPLLSEDSKVFRFGASPPAQDLAWPTVENVAELLSRVAAQVIDEICPGPLSVSRVRVTETHVNAAEVVRRPAGKR